MTTTPSLRTAIGLDLGVKQGALLIAEFSGPSTVYSWRVLSTWRRGPRIDDDPSVVFSFFDRTILSPLNGLTGSTGASGQIHVGIDWDIREVFWRGNRKAVMLKSLVAGYICRGIMDLGLKPEFLSPSVVRSLYGLGPRADKNTTVITALGSLRFHCKVLTGNEHVLDSMVLSHAVLRMARAGGQLDQMRMKPIL